LPPAAAHLQIFLVFHWRDCNNRGIRGGVFLLQFLVSSQQKGGKYASTYRFFVCAGGHAAGVRIHGGIGSLANVLHAAQPTANVVVQGTAGPWLWVNGGLNSSFQYGVNDPTAPTVVNAASGTGFNFGAGSTLSVQYVSGTVSAEVGVFPFTDANGDTSVAENNSRDPSNGYFPSLYFNHAQYPAYLTELVGTFSDSFGNIIGTPFKIGDTASFQIPLGATQLQLGTNDTLFSDNSGSWSITVTETTVLPEPGVCGLAIACGAGLLARVRRAR
jgi:hypothetical protein